MMVRFYAFRMPLIALATLCLLSSAVASRAEETASLGVESATICRDVVAREPVGSGTLFPASAGRLCCFTKIINIQSPTEVTHVWYYGDTERARVTLPVSPPSWRTYSSKIIQPHEMGIWYVDVLGPGGSRLSSVTFEITQ